jgi:hypothetical protein
LFYTGFRYLSQRLDISCNRREVSDPFRLKISSLLISPFQFTFITPFLLHHLSFLSVLPFFLFHFRSFLLICMSFYLHNWAFRIWKRKYFSIKFRGWSEDVQESRAIRYLVLLSTPPLVFTPLQTEKLSFERRLQSRSSRERRQRTGLSEWFIWRNLITGRMWFTTVNTTHY